MTRLRPIALVLAVLAAACGEKKPPARPARPPAASAAPAEAKQDPKQAPAAPEWTYSSIGKRDPFKSFMAEVDNATPGVISRCTTPLGRFELDQLKLVAVVTGLEDPVAMVEGPNGIGYSLRRGACIGRNGGVIAAVRTGEVVVSEWVTRADGTRDKAQTVLKLPREPSLQIEE